MMKYLIAGFVIGFIIIGPIIIFLGAVLTP